MPQQRAKGQKQVIVMMDEEFLNAIDSKLKEMGYDDRAGLIRSAIYEKLLNMGYKIPRELSTAPSRRGKGGRPKKVKEGK